MRVALLRGREHPELGAVQTVAEDRVAIALSRGGAPKRYPHSDPNEDAAGFARGREGVCLAVADGHGGSEGAEIALLHVLGEPAEQWTEEPGPLDAKSWRRQALAALSDANHDVRRERGRRPGRGAAHHARPRARAAEARAPAQRRGRRQPPVRRRRGGRARARAGRREGRLPRRRLREPRRSRGHHAPRRRAARRPARGRARHRRALRARHRRGEPRRRGGGGGAARREDALRRARARGGARPRRAPRSRPTAATAPATTSPWRCSGCHSEASSDATRSAIASEAVRPGDSIPTRFTRPGSPRALSSAITKSRNGSPGACELRADARLVGREPLGAQPGQVAAGGRRELRGLAGVDRRSRGARRTRRRARSARGRRGRASRARRGRRRRAPDRRGPRSGAARAGASAK